MLNSVRPGRNDRVTRAVAAVETTLERTAKYYPADLPTHHYARRTNWHFEPQRVDGILRHRPDAVARFEPLRRQFEVARAHAEALLVSELLGDVILDAEQRERLNRRALGILPGHEAERLREVFACAELQPRHFARSAPTTMAVFEQIEHNVGRATALAYCMLTLAGQHKEEEIVTYGKRLDNVFERVVAAPAVSKALEARVPESPHGLFEALFPLLRAVREQLWAMKPNRVSTEFLLTHVIDNYLGDRSGVGNSLGLALFDGIILGKLGFRVNYVMQDGMLRLHVQIGSQSVFWELVKPLPLSLAPVSSGSIVDLRSFFAITYGSLATMCFTRSLWERAAEAYERALELNPESVETRTSLAICLLREQRPEDAIRELKACLELDPNSAMAHQQLGNAYTMQSNWPKATDSYKRALRISPDTAEVYNNLGFAYLRCGNDPQAVAAFEAAIQHRPDYSEAHFNLANLHMEQQRYDLAIEHYRQTLRIQPSFVAAYYNMGRAEYEKHDLNAAIRCYQKAVELNPKHFGAWHNLGIAYRDQGQTEKAVEALEKAVAINPNLMR
ncbi:MAG TPA: tetratricopeptide repeat protein [bacterium]|nr:tetratricopeptide repeat protein [bacterium]